MRRSTTKPAPKRPRGRPRKYAQNDSYPQNAGQINTGVASFPVIPAVPVSQPTQTNAGPQIPPEPKTGESAVMDVLTVRGQIPAGGYRWNPDLLATNKGWQIYEYMLRDDQVIACLALMSATVTGREWYWDRDDDDDQRDISSFFDEMFENMHGNVKLLLQYMFFSVVFGFSLIEKVYDTFKWNGKDYWGLIDFKNRPQWTFQFQVDHFGNIVGLRQMAYGMNLILPYEKFIHFVYQPEVDPHYGRSALIPVYEHYNDKLYLQRMWNIRIERMATGTIVGKQNLPLDPAQRIALQTAIKNLQSGGAILTPSGVDLSVLQAPETSEFQIRVAELNKAIARSLLQPTDLGLSQTHASGSQARSRTQLDVYYHVTDAINSQMEDAINEQLIRPLVAWNFGPDVEPPCFKFSTRTQEEKIALAQSIVTLMDPTKGSAIRETDEDEAFIRTLAGLPDRDYSKPINRPPAQPPAGSQETGGDLGKLGDSGGSAGKQDGAKNDSANAPLATSSGGTTTAKEPSSPMATATAIVRSSESAPALSWADRVDADGLKLVFKERDASFERELTSSVRSAFDSAIKIVKERGKDARPPDVDAFAMPPEDKRRINRTIKGNLQKIFREGQRSAMSELSSAAKSVQTFAGVMSFTLDDETVADYINSLSFNLTGDLTDTITSVIKKAWIQAIANDLSLDDTIAAIQAALEPILGQPGADDSLTPARLATIVRTNNTAIFNQARKNTFENESLNGFVQAYEFSAVIDDHTTEPCSAMNGRVYSVDSEVWQRFTPPLWYNCRSLIIPVVKGEDWEESPPPPSGLSPMF